MDKLPLCARKNLHVPTNPSRRNCKMRTEKLLTLSTTLVAMVLLAGMFSAATAQVLPKQKFPAPAAKFSNAVAFDASAPLRDLAAARKISRSSFPDEREIRPERGEVASKSKYSGDKSAQTGALRPP